MKPGPKYYLFADTWLRSGEWLTSNNERFYGLLGTDGRFCACEGTGPTDPASRVVHMFPDAPMQAGQYFMIMQSDGNLVIYQGTGPTDNHGFRWGLNLFLKNLPMKAGLRYQANLDDLGNFRVYDWNVDNREGPYWSVADTHAVEQDITVPGLVGIWKIYPNSVRPGPRGSVRMAFDARYTAALTAVSVAVTRHYDETPVPFTINLYRGDVDSQDLMRSMDAVAPWIDLNEFRTKQTQTLYTYPLSAPQIVAGKRYTIELVAPPEGQPFLLIGTTWPQASPMPDVFDGKLCFSTYIRRP